MWFEDIAGDFVTWPEGCTNYFLISVSKDSTLSLGGELLDGVTAYLLVEADPLVLVDGAFSVAS